MGTCSSTATNFEQNHSSILQAAQNNRLLTMEIEPSLRCNFSCPYCYVPKSDELKDELSLEEIRDAVRQAQSLGAHKIIILGGEPTIYPAIRELIEYICSLRLTVEIFTNGSGIDDAMAYFLHAHRARVVLKMNSFDAGLQDRLTGKTGSSKIIGSALAQLKAAGYPSDNAFLAVSTVICQPNYNELEELWRWLRDQGIEPYFEMITPQANALANQWLYVEPVQVYRLFERLAEIDRRHFGGQWEPQPPLVGNRCQRHLFSCLISSQGEVMPCVGLNVSLGNIRRSSIEEILSQSQLIKDLKNYRNTIKGECRHCEKAEYCYGCRGAAYQITGDYLASDPLCWKNCTENRSQN